MPCYKTGFSLKYFLLFNATHATLEIQISDTEDKEDTDRNRNCENFAHKFKASPGHPIREYQNICGTKFSRYLFSALSEFGIFIVFFNEVFSSYVIRVNCVSYISCCQSVCSSFGSATPHATTLFFLTRVTRRRAIQSRQTANYLSC